MPEFVESAVLTHREAPAYVDPNTDCVYTLFAAAKAERILPVKLKVKEYRVTGQDIPQNIRSYLDRLPGVYASSYDTVVLKVEEIAESPIGSAMHPDHNDLPHSPTELSFIRIVDLLDLVKGKNKKYVPGNFANGNGKLSVSGSADILRNNQRYLELAKDPEANREQLQAMVEQAAREAGYDSPVLYHGTKAFGFTEFDLDKMDDKATIFLTDNRRIASTHAGVDWARDILPNSNADVENMDLHDVAKKLQSTPSESGMEYARQGRHWVRGHYSRDGYSQGGYSQGKSDMISMLEDMMRNSNSQEDKQALRQCIDNMRG